MMASKVIETHDSEDSGDSEVEIGNASSNDGDQESDEDDISQWNLNWADSVARILRSNKPKNKKTLVLSKAKKLNEIKREKTRPAGFQVATADGEVKEEKIEVRVEEEINKEPPRKKKRELQNFRVKPNILEKDRERTLCKIATRGVVQLFNAVKVQQNDIDSKLKEAGPLEVRKEKCLQSIDKRAFLDVLMSEKSENVDAVITSKKEGGSTWNVLQDNFMMDAKIKHWDKEEDELEVEREQEIESE